MKFMCFGYFDEQRWNALSKAEQDAFMDEAFAYDDVLRKNGHAVGGDALGSAREARTVRWRNGKASVTDGPFTEAKEQVGGVVILEARDLDHAVELLSKHPGVRVGPFEVRQIVDMSEAVAESKRRRSRKPR